MNLQNGDLIHLLHHSKVKESGEFSSIFLFYIMFLLRNNGIFFHIMQNREFKKKRQI